MLCSSIVEGERSKARRSCKQTEMDAQDPSGRRAVDQRSKIARLVLRPACKLDSELGLIRLATPCVLDEQND